MAEETLHIVRMKDDFYRDSFGKIIVIMASIVMAILLLVALSVYLYLDKPKPVSFPVADEWRVQAPVPLDQPYLNIADLLQWVSDALPKVFVYDFNHYNQELKSASQYFTANGWKVFLNQLNIYANYNNVQSYKLFVNARPAGAPFKLNEGLLSGRYAWWIQMPVDVSYAGFNPPPNKSLVLQVLVVRVSTLNNLMGVGIENIIVANAAGNQVGGNGSTP